MTNPKRPARTRDPSKHGINAPSELKDPPIKGPIVSPKPPQKYTITNRFPRSDGGNSESSIAMLPERRKVLPTPPMQRERKRIGNEDPAMNIMQLKKNTTNAVPIIIQHFTCPAKNKVSGVPMAPPKLQLANSKDTSAVEKKAPVMR
jgi:hypothetical protein